MHQTFTIERMTLKDIEPATFLRLQSWLDTYVNDDAGVTREWIEARNEEQMSPERVKVRQERLNDPSSAGWVAKDAEGTVIGVMEVYHDEAGVQRLGSLYVDREWHGKGVGAKLIQKAIDWFDSALPIELGVVTYNERAKAFYRKWGFEEMPGSEMLFDNKIPEIIMIRKGDK